MIPNIIHFIYGLDPNFGNKPFGLIQYLAVKSAHEVNKPDKIYFVCAYEPTTDWFEKAKPYLEVVKIIAPTQIFGNPLLHFAHQSDVVRLERLLNYGGIYLDMDTICVKSFSPLLTNDFVMGEENSIKSFDSENLIRKTNKGLCNAVILSQPNSSFLLKWYDSYKNFRSKGGDAHWSEHSVVIPGRLSKVYTDEIKILEEQAFFYPSWDEDGLKNLFEYDCSFPEAYVHHLWESIAWWPYLSKIDEHSIRMIDTTYNKIARRFI